MRKRNNSNRFKKKHNLCTIIAWFSSVTVIFGDYLWLLILLYWLIINGCLKIGYFHDAFQYAKIVPIPKPDKNPKFWNSYRPISMLSCFGKFFERVISNRFGHFISITNILPAEQFGFRPQHSTIHQIYRIKNMISFNQKIYW